MAHPKPAPRKRVTDIPLLERILRDEAENPPPPRPSSKQDQWQSRVPPLGAIAGANAPNTLLPLREWAVSIFGEAKPCDNTLRAWAASGKIVPAPTKIGKRLYCVAQATYCRSGTKAEKRAVARQIGSATPSVAGMPRLIPITTWAELTFGEYAPHKNTLLNWIRDAKILPRPVKVGNRYFCSPDAEYFDPAMARVRRMTGG